MKRVLLFSLNVTVLMTLAQNNTLACTCDLPVRSLTLKQQVNEARMNSKAVFSGRVLEIIANPDAMYVVVKFKVQKSWKNVHSEEVSVMTGRGGGDCGFHFEADDTYLVYAYGTNQNDLGTNICQRTVRISEAGKDIRILGKGKIPRDKDNAKRLR